MIDDQPTPAQFRAPKNDNPLPSRDHFLDVMQIKPATCKGLAERGGVILLQHGLKDFSPAETHEPCLHHSSAQADRGTQFFTWEI